jgi:hypothetical protein
MKAEIPIKPICNICNKPVSFATAKTDSRGRTVHERCYLILLKAVRFQ